MRYFVIAAVVQFVWSLTPSASNVVIRYLPVESYIALRYTVSGLIFLGISLHRYGGLRLAKRDVPGLAALGIATYGLASLGTLYGLKLGGVLNFGLASSLNAVITSITAMVVLRERVSRGFLLGVPVSLAGGMLLLAGKYELSGMSVAGGSLALIFAAYVCEALGFAFSRRYKSRYPLPAYLAICQLSGAAFMWIVSLALGRSPAALFTMPPLGWVSFLFVALVACVACFGILYWLLNHIEGHKLAFFDCFHTLGASAWGALFFHDKVNATMLAGGLLLVGSLYLIASGQKATPISARKSG